MPDPQPKPPKFTAIAERVHGHGYTPIPCNGKRPIAEGWQHTPHTQEALAANLQRYPWAANTGILAAPAAALICWLPWLGWRWPPAAEVARR